MAEERGAGMPRRRRNLGSRVMAQRRAQRAEEQEDEGKRNLCECVCVYKLCVQEWTSREAVRGRDTPLSVSLYIQCPVGVCLYTGLCLSVCLQCVCTLGCVCDSLHCVSVHRAVPHPCVCTVQDCVTWWLSLKSHPSPLPLTQLVKDFNR